MTTNPKSWVGLRCVFPEGDPLDFFAPNDPERFFWDRSIEGRGFAARGALQILEFHDAARFKDADVRAIELLSRIDVRGDLDGAESDPRLSVGFAFAPKSSLDGAWSGFPSGRIVLPRVIVARHGSGIAVTWFRAIQSGESLDVAHLALERERAEANAPLLSTKDSAVEPREASFRAESCETPSHYRALVSRAVAALAEGELEKVVLARAAHLEAAAEFDAHALVRQLRSSHPSCTAFAVGRNDADFLGATPERLLRVEGTRIETWALAGSTLRGRNPDEDRALANSLLESKKDQAEHEIVVRAVTHALRDACLSLDVREAPRILRLEGIQHLETPIVGELGQPEGLLSLAGRLHPTPAVSGAPKQAALDWIDANEGFDRGWYAGAVGYVTPSGGGELAIALRSALLRGRSARCFAGAGIVPSSDPTAELAETRLKLRTMLAPLMEL